MQITHLTLRGYSGWHTQPLPLLKPPKPWQKTPQCPLGPSPHTYSWILGSAITVPMGAKNEWNRLSWDEKRHRSLSLTDCPPWGPGKVWRGLALCKNLQTQSIPLECGPDCWNHLESPWIAPRVGFMGRALHPGYHTRATPVLIPACVDRGQVLLCLQPLRTPHLRRPLWKETDFHLSLLSLTIFLSDPQAPPELFIIPGL